MAANVYNKYTEKPALRRQALYRESKVSLPDPDTGELVVDFTRAYPTKLRLLTYK